MSAERGQHATQQHAPQPHGAHPLLLAFGLFGGTGVWTVHLIGSYTISNYLCGEAFATLLIYVLTAGTLAVAVASTLVSLRILLTEPPSEDRGPQPASERDRFLASGGIVLGGLAIMAMLFGVFATATTGCAP